MTFVLLNDPTNQRQRLIRYDHVSAVDVSKSDESVTLYLVGGQEVHLSHEESKQFVQHVKAHLHPPKGA
jgi:hypothetical protein